MKWLIAEARDREEDRDHCPLRQGGEEAKKEAAEGLHVPYRAPGQIET